MLYRLTQDNPIHRQKPKRRAILPLGKFTYIVTLSMIYAVVMLMMSTIFADVDHIQSTIMPSVAMLFVPLFLRQ